MEWTKQDSESAQKEGWDIFYCADSLDGDWQVQQLDEVGILESDGEAWELVASQRTEAQKKAFLFIMAHNPQEMLNIISRMKDFVSFENLGINVPFKFQDSDRPMVKIDESRYIFIGENGAHSVAPEERCFLKVFPI